MTEWGGPGGQPPGSIEMAPGNQSLNERAARRVNIDVSEAGSGNVILRAAVLERVAHEDLAVDTGDAERGVASGEIRINKAPPVSIRLKIPLYISTLLLWKSVA